MGRLFGTDGARGVAITELTCELVMNIGRAAAIVLTMHERSKKPNILIGKDTRISSDALEAALIAGITSVGVDVSLLGVVPTPAVAYLVKEYNADAGVMISASHNTVEYNGIKLIGGNGFKLPDELEEEIESLVLDTPEKIVLKSGIEIGRISTFQNAADDYIKHIKSTTSCRFDGLKVLIDCSNGSASKTAREIFTGLGAECTYIADNPDGCNINENCGSTHVDKLCSLAKEGSYDLAVAFDGDADRCLAVDGNGKIVDGDRLIAIMSRQMKAEGVLKQNTAVVTVMSNLGFHQYMKENDINTVCTVVGDRYVLEEMLEKGYCIGGEQSGHIIFFDYATTGDGQLTAVQLLALLKKTGRTLAALTEDIKDYPQCLKGLKVSSELHKSWKQNTVIMDMIKAAEADFGADGRVLVRASGTEPLIRVMIEGKSEEKVNKWVDEIVKSIEKVL